MPETQQKSENGAPRQGPRAQQRKRPPAPRRRHPATRPGGDDSQISRTMRMLLTWVLLVAGVFMVVVYLRHNDEPEYEVTFTQYERYLEESSIESARVTGTAASGFEFHGHLRAPITEHRSDGQPVKFQLFVTRLGVLDAPTEQRWREKGVTFNFEANDGNWLGPTLLQMLPWIGLAFVYLLLMRRMQSGGAGGPKGLFSFGKSRAKVWSEGGPKFTFADVAGADEAKVELSEIIEFLREPSKFQRLGGKIPKGVLMLGPPGTGKTLLARAVAGEAAVPFYSISGADFVEMFVGVGASRVRDLFEQAKRSAPCIVFIDEIDAVGRQRGAGLGGGHDEREQTLNQLLVEMDGFEQNLGIVLIAATNRPDVLDPALLRPGRFDRQVIVDRPDVRGREGILKVHARTIPLGADVDLGKIARSTPGMSGADLANLINEAALLAARRSHVSVMMDDVEEAKDKVMMGVERKSMIMSDEEKKKTAYHEIGHVLVSKFTKGSDPVHKVTIIPRGRALGLTAYLPIDDKHTYSREFIEGRITSLLGGRSAEILVFNELTTGAADDIDRATELARKMVCEWGMSDKLGPLAFGAREEEIFLGREITRKRNFSEATAVGIDAEIHRIIDAGSERALGLLREHIKELHAMAGALVERETLDSDEIDRIIAGETLPPLEPKAAV